MSAVAESLYVGQARRYDASISGYPPLTVDVRSMSVAMLEAGWLAAAGDWASTFATPSAVGGLKSLPTLIETTPRSVDLTAESSAYPMAPSVSVRPPTTPEVPSRP